MNTKQAANASPGSTQQRRRVMLCIIVGSIVCVDADELPNVAGPKCDTYSSIVRRGAGTIEVIATVDLV